MPLDQIERYRDRAQAGQLLAQQLSAHAGRQDVIVLGLPRGGVPVAAQVADRLQLALDVLPVRKLGFPGYQEFAMGALASGGVCVLQDDVVAANDIPRALIDAEIATEARELARREQRYRGARLTPLSSLMAQRTVILVDDGMATGATMKAAVQAARLAPAARVIVAVPLASRDACKELGALADQCICLSSPEPFNAVGAWYDSFEQVNDEEVIALLDAAALMQASMQASKEG
jgi:putative phosphoribosyl transferase